MMIVKVKIQCCIKESCCFVALVSCIAICSLLLSWFLSLHLVKIIHSWRVDI